MKRREVILDSGATTTVIRPQDEVVPTGEKSSKIVYVPDERAIQDKKVGLLSQGIFCKLQNVPHSITYLDIGC